jgi:hypothetical protein
VSRGEQESIESTQLLSLLSRENGVAGSRQLAERNGLY